jgi:hypothetical protein
MQISVVILPLAVFIELICILLEHILMHFSSIIVSQF